MEENITYDENWQSVSYSEYPKPISPEPEKDDEPKKQRGKFPKQYLLTAQLVVCVLLGLAAFALKSIGGEAYGAIREWYYSELNSAAVFDPDSGFDINTLLGRATSDEADDT